jgi:hypothetical protein
MWRPGEIQLYTKVSPRSVFKGKTATRRQGNTYLSLSGCTHRYGVISRVSVSLIMCTGGAVAAFCIQTGTAVSTNTLWSCDVSSQAVAACRSRPDRGILPGMGTKSRETIYGASVRASEERTAEARKVADRLACEAWNKRMLGFQGPAQPSPTLGDALNAGYLYLEVKCLGCNTHQTVALGIVRRRRRHPSMSWSDICGARIARRFGATRISAAIWWRCVRRKYLPMTHRPLGGRENDDDTLHPVCLDFSRKRTGQPGIFYSSTANCDGRSPHNGPLCVCQEPRSFRSERRAVSVRIGRMAPRRGLEHDHRSGA